MKDDIFVIRHLNQFESITQIIEENGYSYFYPVLKHEIVEANKFVSEMLKIPIATKVFSFKRLRIVEGIPRTIDQVYIDSRKVKGIENKSLKNKSLYNFYYEEYGYKVLKNEEEIKIVLSSEEESELLNIYKGSEVVLSMGNSYLDSLDPFEFYQVIAIPTFYKYRSVKVNE